MSNKNFKISDWCFCEFKLSQIQDIDNGQVREISTGFIVMSGLLSDRCFPLSKHVLMASSEADHWKKELHSRMVPNMPDVHRKLVRLWCEICESEGDEKRTEKSYEAIRAFAKGIIDRVDDLKRSVADLAKA